VAVDEGVAGPQSAFLTGVDVMLEGVLLRRDRVLAVPARVPGGRGPIPAPLLEFVPPLRVDDVNPLGGVDRGDLRQLYPR
jgi:hypothetical protein